MAKYLLRKRRRVLLSTLLAITSILVITSEVAASGAHKAYFDSPEGQIHYWTAGEGPNLFLIHQSSQSNEEYLGLIPYLSKHYRLIAIDLPGHGHSDDPSSPHNVDNLTAAAIALADHLNLERLHVLGHHGGALVAMNMAAKIPDRVVKTILSGSSGPKTPEEAEKFKKTILSRGTVLDWEGKSLAETWKRYTSLRSDDARIEDIFKPYLMKVRTSIRPYDVFEAYLTWNRNPALNALKGPVLLVQGDKDSFVSHQERLLEILPDSKRAELKGGGPFMFYEHPKLCADIIRDFLK